MSNGAGRTVPCRDCQASIIWCETETGARMPVDAKPVRKVLVLKVNPRNPGGAPLAKFVDQYESHFAHCSAAKERRGTGKTKTKPAGQGSARKETKTDA